MTETAGRDEGAAQTRLIMKAIPARRKALGWSAEGLAAEMNAAGVPWNANIVANLELGRRKSLRVHELLTLAYVLDVPPIELLVPPGNRYPATPRITVTSAIARAWIKGEISLRGDDSDAAIRKAYGLADDVSTEEVDTIRRLLGPVVLHDLDVEEK
jgi:transcriptional regulator with XRE-family HTH domain